MSFNGKQLISFFDYTDPYNSIASSIIPKEGTINFTVNCNTKLQIDLYDIVAQTNTTYKFNFIPNQNNYTKNNISYPIPSNLINGTTYDLTSIVTFMPPLQSTPSLSIKSSYITYSYILLVILLFVFFLLMRKNKI